MSTTDPGALVRTLRLGLLGLAALSVLATAYELAAERHWDSLVRLVPWVTLLGLAVAIGLAATRRPVLVATARVLAGLALLSALFGIYEHVAANQQVGALDATYSESWDNRSELSRWFLAVTKSVGVAPPLAPGVLGQGALLVLLATAGLGRGAQAADAEPGPGAGR